MKGDNFKLKFDGDSGTVTIQVDDGKKFEHVFTIPKNGRYAPYFMLNGKNASISFIN